MTYSKIIAKRILQLIEIRHGISVNELAKKAGMEPATINKVLNNRVGNPSIGTLIHIAKAFDIPVSILLDIDELNKLSIKQIKEMNGRKRNKDDIID